MESFMESFEQQLSRLDQVNDRIQTSTENRNRFSTQLLSRLRNINSTIKELDTGIGKLKRLIDSLQDQQSGNSVDIQQNKAELDSLRAELNGITAERDQLIQGHAELASERDGLAAEIAQHKSRIVELEQQLLAGEPDKELLQRQLQELDGLKSQLASSEAELITIKESSSKSAEELNQLRAEKDAITSRLQELEANNSELTDKNALIQQRIVIATTNIQRAVDNFNNLLDILDNEQSSSGEVSSVLNEIEASVEQIKQSLEVNAASGVVPPSMPTPALSSAASVAPAVDASEYLVPSSVSDNEILTIKQQDGSTVEMSLRDIKKGLTEKNNKLKQRDPDNDYAKILKKLKSATTKAEAEQILNNSQKIKNGKVTGGKTKKHRKAKKSNKVTKKHRGGFRYNIKSKRRTISTTSSSKPISKRSSRRSSRRASN
jgi:hypothetical protein